MSIKDVGDGIAKYWAPVTGIVGLIALTAVALSQVNESKAKIESLEPRLQTMEKRFQTIEWYLVRIGEKVGVRFPE